MLNNDSNKLTTSTVLFLDAEVADYSSLLKGIAPDIAVFILDAARDGVRQITQVLRNNHYQKVHIISHGAPGCLFLGNSQLSLDTLDKYQEALKTWFYSSPSRPVSPSPSLVIYGCQVAVGDAGAEFLEKLHQLTRANLAASASLTGNEKLGGNWQLEVTVGEVVADVVLAEETIAVYRGVLDRATLVKDIFPGIDSSSASELTELNGKLYFQANDGVNGRELWVTDGKTAGTQLLKDIFPGISYDYYGNSYSNSSFPSGFTEFNDKLYFSAFDNVNGTELWVSDGTTAGTQLLADINPGGSGSSPGKFTEFNDKLYFSAFDNVNNGTELWVSDGTTAGTQLLADINPGGSSSYPGKFTEFNDKLYFSAFDNVNGTELWVSDGTTAGTQLLADINPGPGNFYYDSPPRYLTELNGKLYFQADDGVHGRELWVSDGTTAGTQLLADINPGRYPSNSYQFTELNGKLYFQANDGVHGRELWVTDGTTAGTQLLKDINNTETYFGFRNSSDPSRFTELNGRLYFSANDGINGRELWVSDGTTAGTQLLKDIAPGSFGSSSGVFTELNGKLYFQANDGVNGTELWVTDGTTAGTQLVQDIRSGSGSSNLGILTVVNNELFFTANDGVHGFELFKLTASNTINGTAKSERLTGTAGDDDISGLAGNDILSGLDGNDILLGGLGNDSLSGGDGDDTLKGDEGNDTLTGNAGNDSLTGGVGNDTLTGGTGNDILDGGKGNDVLTGNADNDIFVLRTGDGKDTISDFQLGQDLLGLSDGLTFEGLTFSTNSISFGDEILATLTGIQTNTLTPDNFTVI